MNCRVLTTPSRTKVFFLLLMQAFLLYLFIQYSLNPELTETSVEDGSDHRPLMVDKSTIPPTAKPLAILASERRVRFIKEYCSKSKEEVIRTYPYFLDYLQTLLNWIWMVSPKHHLFYCATPKSGSTTWKSYIMEDLKINWTGLDTHDAATSYIGSLEVYNEINLTTVEFLETYRPENRFLFVRNPWARLASAYDDKIKDKKWKLKNLCIGWEIYQNVKKVTFEQFIDCILERPERLLYQPHTHPVSSLCAVCHMDYNVILKLEELDEAEAFLKKTLNFTITPDYKPPRKLKNNAYKENYKNISEVQLERLQHVYRYDIELFGFPKSPFD